MPTLTDTDITTWTADYQTLGASSANIPKTADLILGLMAEQFQNIKSVVRAESENKQWERWALPATYVSNPTAKTTVYSIPGNVRYDAVPPGPVDLNRAVLVITGGVTQVGYITSLITTSPTTFRVAFASTAPSSSPSEMMFGVTTQTNSGGRHFYQTGTTQISTGTSATVTFVSEEADASYGVLMQLVGTSGPGPFPDLNFITLVAFANRATTGFTYTIGAAVPASSAIAFYWAIFR